MDGHDHRGQVLSGANSPGRLALPPRVVATGLDWLVKLDASGRPQWQEELGCLSLPPGSYTDGVSLQQTSDGGYIVGGGTIGCGSGTSCPATSGLQCALAEKVDASGRLQWAYVYPAGAGGSSIRQIRQTSDGLAGTCSDEHAATPLTAIDPLVTSFSPVLPVLSAITLGSASPSGTSATSIGTQVDC